MSSKRKAFDNLSTSELDGMVFEDDSAIADLFGNLPRQRLNQLGIIPTEDGAYRFGKVTLQACGLNIPDGFSANDWTALGRVLTGLQQRMQWILGDWLAYGEDHQYGETFKQLAEETGLDVTTLYDYAYVCRKVQFSVRTEKLTFGHHKLTSAMDTSDQQIWLTRAAENGWSIAQMRAEINGKRLPDGQAQRPLLSVNWRKPWQKMGREQRQTMLDEMRQIVREMESALDED